MAGSAVSTQHTGRRFVRWLLEERIEELMTTSFVTTLLIPESAFGPNGEGPALGPAYVAQEVLREAEPNPERRPAIHLGGR